MSGCKNHGYARRRLHFVGPCPGRRSRMYPKLRALRRCCAEEKRALTTQISSETIRETRCSHDHRSPRTEILGDHSRRDHQDSPLRRLGCYPLIGDQGPRRQARLPGGPQQDTSRRQQRGIPSGRGLAGPDADVSVPIGGLRTCTLYAARACLLVVFSLILPDNPYAEVLRQECHGERLTYHEQQICLFGSSEKIEEESVAEKAGEIARREANEADSAAVLKRGAELKDKLGAYSQKLQVPREEWAERAEHKYIRKVPQAITLYADASTVDEVIETPEEMAARHARESQERARRFEEKRQEQSKAWEETRKKKQEKLASEYKECLPFLDNELQLLDCQEKILHIRMTREGEECLPFLDNESQLYDCLQKIKERQAIPQARGREAESGCTAQGLAALTCYNYGRKITQGKTSQQAFDFILQLCSDVEVHPYYGGVGNCRTAVERKRGALADHIWVAK